MLRTLRAASRMARVLATGLASAAAQLLFFGPVLHNKTFIPALFARQIRRTAGIHVIFNDLSGAAGQKPDASDRTPKLVIANHLSYFDPVLLTPYTKAAFVAKQEIRQWPLIGRFAGSIGTIFIARTPAALKNVQKAIVENLNDGRNVALFPEAKTGRGDDVLPFKAGALSVAFNNVSGTELAQEIKVKPYAFRLKSIEGKPVAGKAEMYGQYSWHGQNNGFLSHFWNLLHIKNVEIELTALPEMNPADYKDRRAFTQAAENLIRAHVLPHDLLHDQTHDLSQGPQI